MEIRAAVASELLPPLRALDVLAEPTRRLILQLLAQQPATVTELARRLRQSQPLVSKHLRVLREAGLVEASVSPADGRVRVYELRREQLAELEAWLADLRATWRRRTRHTPLDPDYYKHPGPGVNRTTRGKPRQRYPRTK